MHPPGLPILVLITGTAYLWGSQVWVYIPTGPGFGPQPAVPVQVFFLPKTRPETSFLWYFWLFSGNILTFITSKIMKKCSDYSKRHFKHVFLLHKGDPTSIPSIINKIP